MKTNPTHKVAALTLLFLALSFLARAGSITNNFDTSYDYVANGIMGDPNWDGVYLNFGDIPNGDPGGSGNGATLVANANGFPSTLSITTTRGDWSAPGDDGFFIWKLVSGDFDVSVESVPTWSTTANSFAGLLARAYNTNNSGSPYSTTVTNGGENWVSLLRGQEFNIDETRLATNGGNIELTFGDNIAGTNQTRFFRIVRSQGTNFTFFWKTNAEDGWVQRTNGTYYPNGVYVRSDLAGVSMQVGICHAMFSGNNAQVYFTDFELTGSNVNPPPAMPPAPANVTSSFINSNSVALSWTTNGGDGSLVVIRPNKLLIANPVQGQTYTGNTNFQNPNTLLSASGSHIVYAGPATNITVTGLGGSNNTYNAYVFSYSGSGPAIAYNTIGPASNNFAGPGTVTAVSFTVSPTNLPVGGAGVATIIATYNSGDSYDVSSDPSALLSSSDPTIITVNNGAMSALTNGSVQITASYAGISATNNVSVHTPAFTDNFGISHNYNTDGLVGTPYDGLFLNFGDVPLANNGPDAVNGQTLSLDANISTNNELAFSGLGGTWRSGGNDGMFLHKVVSGDFQVAVHVNAMNTLNFNAAGVMARLFNNPALGPIGGPGGAGNNETHVEWWKIQAGALSRRYTIDSTHTGLLPGSEQAGLANDTWLLMQRVNSTNFLFFEKANATDPWNPVPLATCVIPEAAGNALMEVGLSQEMRQATVGTVQFDNLMIDGVGIGSPAGTPPPAPPANFTATLNGDLSMTFHWVATDAAGINPVRSLLVMRAGAPVDAQPNSPIGANFGGGSWNFGVGPSLGGSNFVVYVTGNPAASTNVSTTVFGLTPGVVYYAAVYTFVGAGGTKSFNAIGLGTNVQDGILLFIETVAPPPIPLGGLRILQVLGHYQGGAIVNVSAFASIVVTNGSVIQTADGTLSGMGLGSTFVTASYNGFTNTVGASVVPPTFTEEFNVNQDYVANHTAGSSWDGVYLNAGDIPESGYVGTGQTISADANVSSNAVLTVTNSIGGWAADQNDGFFLFKYVPGDFQAVVHVLSYQISAYNEAGILARLYTTGTNGTDIGAPFMLGTSTNADGNAQVNGETWVGFTKFDEFNIGTYARKNIDNKEYQFGQNNQNTTDNWLLILRQNLTNFFFYERTANTGPWRATPGKVNFSGSGALPDFAGQPMQVGIQVTPYTAGPGGVPLYAQFEHYMLDFESGLILKFSISGHNIILNWPADPLATLQSTPGLNPSNWQPVSGTPTLGANGYSLSVPIGPGSQLFRLAH